MSFRRGFKAEANRIALRVREQLGLSPIAPVDPAAVCTHFDIDLIRLSELNPASPFLHDLNSIFSAVTVPRGSRQAIVYNDSHHLYRQRSNVCHELAHCFPGHQCAPPLLSNGERARDGGIEAEANFLAGALLLPNEAAIYIVRQGLVPTAQQVYGVSEPMLTYRLRVSGAYTIQQRRAQLIRGSNTG